MRLRNLLFIGVGIIAGFAAPALADLTYTQGSGTTIFDFVCFTTKHCSAHVPVNSAGTEIATTSNPFQVGAPAAAFVDGWDVTQGAKADAAWVSGSGSVIALLKNIAGGVAGSIPAGSALIGDVNVRQGGTALSATNPSPVAPNAYPVGATAITASATGTTAATTATLAAAVAKTTYICSLSVRANATANTNVTNTVTGVITGTLSRAMWVPANTAGLGIDEQIYSPCVPASTTNTAIAVVSGAPGTGGVVTVNATGYQQ